MTIVEAAAFGVPSLLHCGTIGAKDLLPPAARFETGAPLASDFPRPLLKDFLGRVSACSLAQTWRTLRRRGRRLRRRLGKARRR